MHHDRYVVFLLNLLLFCFALFSVAFYCFLFALFCCTLLCFVFSDFVLVAIYFFHLICFDLCSFALICFALLWFVLLALFPLLNFNLPFMSCFTGTLLCLASFVRSPVCSLVCSLRFLSLVRLITPFAHSVCSTVYSLRWLDRLLARLLDSFDRSS